MKIPKNVISGFAILALCVLGATGAADLPAPAVSEWSGTSTLPWFSLGATAFFGIILIVQGLLNRNTGDSSFGISKKACLFFLLWVAYMALMAWLGKIIAFQEMLTIPANGGFAIATALFLLVALPVLGRRKPLEILCVSFGVPCALLLVFSVFFKVQLP